VGLDQIAKGFGIHFTTVPGRSPSSMSAFFNQSYSTRHEFTADKPDELWIGDITEHWTGEGRLYLCAFTEVPPGRHRLEQGRRQAWCGGRLCGSHRSRVAVSQPKVRRCAQPPLDDRIDGQGRGPAATTPPWNPSSPCSTRTSSTDNPWATRDQLRIAIVTWIERTYHRRRRQHVLGRLTPIEYETIMTTTTTQAA
jgi:hypothetical protein